jgi:hypothetical protein
MLRWTFVALHLRDEASAARRDTRIRFLEDQVELLRRKLGGDRVIPSQDDRARVPAIGQKSDDDHGLLDAHLRVVPGMTAAPHLPSSCPAGIM